LQEIGRQPLILCHPQSCSGGYDVVCRWFSDSGLTEPKVAEYVSGHEPMLMLVAAGYGIGVGLESQIALHSHPDVIIRPVTDDVPSTTTYIVITDRPPPEELSRFIDRARQIGEMTIN
jgi:DNA-binding transcriptional LysR family regulator